MENEIVKKNENGNSLQSVLMQADLFVKSGFFPKHVDTKEKAAVIMLKGRELGLPFTEALSKISVIQGVATTKVETMLGLAQSRGIIEDLKIIDAPTHCEVTIKRKGQTPYTCRFGDAEALSLGLNQRDNYKKQKATMYRWRALAMNLRITCPDAIGGLYLEEEISDVITDMPKAGEETQVTEILPKVEENKPIENYSESPKEEISDDQAGNYVLRLGKYKGMRLTQIAEQITDTGKTQGLDYLEWCAENIKDDSVRSTIQRFLHQLNQI